MHVVATAGHVDHGKSTLVQRLTGQHPDRLEEERRRGLTIELGYCWTDLPGLGEVAFVDVPGHERFLSTMLAGVGPVPAAMLVVAADDPWMPQAAEHLAALDAFGVGHAVAVVSRADLADPAPTVARVRAELAATSLAGAEVVAVSARTGAGLDRLRTALVSALTRVPAPAPAADVRLWVDRHFSKRGAGTVVTGTLPAGTVRLGDTLLLQDRPLRVRGIQALGSPVPQVSGTARVALNLAGEATAALERGSVLVTPDAFLSATTVDVGLREATATGSGPPERPLLHVGSTTVSVHCRPLADDMARLVLERPLPLRVGDRAVLRDPGGRRLWGVRVLDPLPPPLTRRGAAGRRARELAGGSGWRTEVARRGLVAADVLRRLGCSVPPEAGATEPDPVVRADGWLLSEQAAADAVRRAAELETRRREERPLDPPLDDHALAARADLPTAGLLRAARRRVPAGAAPSPQVPPAVRQAATRLTSELAESPFAAPTADRLVELGLDPAVVAAGHRSGLLLRLASGVVVLPETPERARERLATLPQPFTTSQARVALGTSRRVALALLDQLDRAGVTRRHPDDTRSLRD